MALRKSTILVVDDNQDIRDLVTLILADEGFTTLDAKDANEAMEVLEKSHPSLVLLDVMMPGKSGIELLREIRAHRDSRINETPVLMMTAKSEIVDIDLAISAGASSYIVKPFIAESVIDKVIAFLPEEKD
ncbi:unannotated protein [freshwater metagenome]|uniref:Unannotated protein n=1 Tax=freshwater metagenome TaxID=449393 RepID=A0A6J6RNE6_9ZZZZ|nr:response regulator [Actinomycetota bacterium]MSW98913.1 response regulator [Actinomycetota bacterium]MSY82584.1 response regulator [Actinomycetota bacterium]MSZ45696.1 response regulator [Actinomycetota bacterium]